MSLVLMLATTAFGAQITVCASGCDANDISAAAASAVDGDELVLSGETYALGGQPIAIGGKQLTITGVSPQATIIDGSGVSTGAAIEVRDDGILNISNVRVIPPSGGRAIWGWGDYVRLDAEGLWVTDAGSDLAGIGIWWCGGGVCDITVRNSRFENLLNNFVDDGAAIRVEGDTATAIFEGVSFIGNQARVGGALSSDAGVTELLQSTFDGNRALDGAGAAGSGSWMVTDTAFVNNESLAPAGTNFTGGSLYLGVDASLTMVRGSVTDNAGTGGGAGVVGSSAGRAQFDGTHFLRNDSYGGAAIAWEGGVAGAGSVRNELDRLTIADNTGEESGAVLLTHDTVVNRVDFERNTANDHGGGIRMMGSATLNTIATNFDDNNALSGFGGAIYMDMGLLTIDSGDFTGNGAIRGGAISTRAPAGLTATEAVFFQNSANQSGAAIFAQGAGGSGSVILDNSTVWNSTSSDAAVYSSGYGVGVLRSYFCGNNGGLGAALYATGLPEPALLSNSLFVANTTSSGAPVYLEGEVDVAHSMFLDNSDGAIETPFVMTTDMSVFAFNSGAPAVVSPTLLFGTNLFFDNLPDHASETLPVTQLVEDPLLSGNTGGFGCNDTDWRPRLDSPLIDMGTSGTGAPDLDGSAPDLGIWGGADAPPAEWIDGDSDGTPYIYDCDDNDGTRGLQAPELCNGIDDDCDGLVDDADPDVADATLWHPDADDDGYAVEGATLLACAKPPLMSDAFVDCDDTDDTVNPDADEIPYDGIDQDCDGSDLCDVDGDGLGGGDGSDSACSGEDCNDNDATVGAPNTWYLDVDGDGFGADQFVLACDQPADTTRITGDCDDGDEDANPDGTEIPYDGIDQDCLEGDLCDVDGDGLEGGGSCRDDDCDDDDASVGGPTTWYPDTDGDGFGDGSSQALAIECDQPSGFSISDDDCDDTAELRYPGAPEQCNEVDDDCDTLVDEDVVEQTWYLDSDGDGFGDADSSVVDCQQPADHVLDSSDCDDSREAVNPDASEICDPDDIDEDCSGAADDSDTSVTGDTRVFTDADDDGFGADDDLGVLLCDPPIDAVFVQGDCDDGDAAVNPDAVDDWSNDLDDNCDGAQPVTALTGGSGLACGCSSGGEAGWLALFAVPLVLRRRRA